MPGAVICTTNQHVWVWGGSMWPSAPPASLPCACGQYTRDSLDEMTSALAAERARTAALVEAGDRMAAAYESPKLEAYADYIGRIGAAVRAWRALFPAAPVARDGEAEDA